MIDRIIVFYGSKRDFESFCSGCISECDITIPFMELIQHYNARLRLNDSGVRESELSRNIAVDNCIVRSDDYGSVMAHVLPNFVNIVSLNHEIGTLFVQNPPMRVLQSLASACPDIIEYKGSEYQEITRDVLQLIYKNLNIDILGQHNCKKKIISGLYRLTSTPSDQPAVLLLYGPSGVGKTETAKSISKTLGGDLLRIQFSMMQSNEAYDYVFGAEHSKSSFARDMLARESNVVLIDEFDKVNPIFYNAFYQLFDEGKYVDANYEVLLKRTIFCAPAILEVKMRLRKILGQQCFQELVVVLNMKILASSRNSP